MPVLNIRALPQKISDNQIKTALSRTSVEIAKVYGCSESQVWVTWSQIEPGFYVEGNLGKDIQPATSHPPLCELICLEGKSSAQIEEILKVAANALSSGLGIPNNIFITYREAKSGEVIAGNGIVKKKS